MGDDELPNVVYFDCLAVFVVVVSGYISREKARVLLHPGVGDTARRGEDNDNGDKNGSGTEGPSGGQ